MAIDLDEAKVQRNEFGLWLGWTLATAAGMIVGYLLAKFLVNGLNLDLGIARVLVPLLVGFLIGFAQWLVLRGFMTYSHDWILANGAGWAIGYALGLFIVQALSASQVGIWVGYILFGILIGLVQWPILRREIPNAFYWILASVVGWTLGSVISFFVLKAASGGGTPDPYVVTAVDSGLTGLIAGAITGIVLVWLVRQPDRPVVS